MNNDPHRSQHDSPADHNRNLVRRTMDALNRKDLIGASAAMAEDLVNHCAIPEAQGRAGLLAIWEKLLTAFPDLSWTCEDLIADGDRIAFRTRERGTNTGPLRFARLPLPPTGKPFDIEAIFVFRIAGGRIAEVWMQRDDLAMLRQLGQLMPPGGAAGPQMSAGLSPG